MMKNIKGINNDTLGQIFGVQPCNIKRDHISGYPICVNGHFADDSILPLSTRTNYGKITIEFARDVSICHIDDENISSMTSKDCLVFKQITHKDVWDHRLTMYDEEQIVVIKQKNKPRKEEIWGKGEKIDRYLNDIFQLPNGKSLANRIKNIIEKFDIKDVENEMHLLLDINELPKLSAGIFREGTLLHELFNIKDDGMGKGEITTSFLIESTVSGTSKSFDNFLKHTKKRLEVKAPSSSKSSFRFGTKGGIGNYVFYENIKDARTVIQHMINQIGIDSLKTIMSKELFELSMQLVKTGNFTIEKDALSSAIDAAEISAEKFKSIQLWFCLAHIETKDMGIGSINQDIFSKQYDVDIANMKFVLRSLRYVKDPTRLMKDINTEIKKCFKDIDYLVIFKEDIKEISICSSADDIMMAVISQNGIKVIEKKHGEKTDNVMKAFDMWKEDNNIDFYKTFLELELGITIPEPIICR